MSVVGVQIQPISRTYQYRKVMKPMLERKRRARINRCLDELKEILLSSLQAEGENVSKLEKADILEFTVQHLHKLRQSNSCKHVTADTDRFRAGFTHCASEVSRCLAATPGVDVTLGTKLMTHLGLRLNEMDKRAPLSVRVTTDGYSSAPCSPGNSNSSAEVEYNMPLTPNSPISWGTYSPRSSPRQLDSSGDLFTVMDMSTIRMTSPVPAKKMISNSSSMWRPW